MNRRRAQPARDYEEVRRLLMEEFATVETQVMNGREPALTDALVPHFDVVFQSRTQAYREALLGCVLAKIRNRTVDIHKPYMNQGEDAYNARPLDEQVVNPFLHERRIPCSRGPFLAAFRRGFMFVRNAPGVRDRAGYDSLFVLIDTVAQEQDEARLREFLQYLLFRFIRLREAAEVPLVRLHRLSVEQHDDLIGGLLAVPSGGRFPVMLVEATFIAIREALGLEWAIEVQGINVADRPGGAGGDITIRRGHTIVLAAEITERPIDRARVIATFQTKIAPAGIEDYMFLVANNVDEDAIRQARQYFAQGHEINFLQIKDWIRAVLATIGRQGRDVFGRVLIEKLQSRDMPTALRVAWNDQIARITAT